MNGILIGQKKMSQPIKLKAVIDYLKYDNLVTKDLFW
jgi:hypothetical protein